MTRQPLVARHAEELLGSAVAATAPVAGGDVCVATKLRLSDGTTALMKTLNNAPASFFETEARGLRWLAEAAGDAVPDVLAGDQDCLILKVTVAGDGGCCHTGRRSCFYRRVEMPAKGPAALVFIEQPRSR